MGVHLLTNKPPRLSLIIGLHLIKLNDFCMSGLTETIHIILCHVQFFMFLSGINSRQGQITAKSNLK